jgi:hypothetical protein
MGSNGARIAVLGVAVAAVVVLFIVLSGGDDDEPSTTAATTTTTTTTTPADDENQPKPEPKPDVPTIEVKNGEAVGGVQDLEFTAGDDIVFKVTSDEAAEVHFHGYDVAEEVEAGGEVEFDVPADIEGVFEVELEETAVQIAEVTVSPS